MTSYKHLFSRALGAAPGRLHFAAHSHHLWPDAARAAQTQVFDDAAELADDKWSKIMGEVWPRAQREVASELALPDPSGVVFAPNTHELLVRLFSAAQRRPVRVLTTDGEFHSFRRQAARWAEAGTVSLAVVETEPFDTFPARFMAAARGGAFDVIWTSHVFFKTGRVFDAAFELADLARPDGPWVVIDGYHGFMALPADLSAVADRVFYLAGGYKYAMAGEGAAFVYAPKGFALRPEITGWYAEFEDISAPPETTGYAPDARRLLGATFDSSGLYRFCAVRRMLADEGLTTRDTAAYIADLQAVFLAEVEAGGAGPLGGAELLNPPGEGPHARFLAFRHKDAPQWKAKLHAAGVVTDVRDDVIRFGFGLYHDPEDVAEACLRAASALR